MNQIKIFNSISELFDFSVADFYNRAILAIDEKDIFTVVLSGGNTSKLFFNGLAISPYKIPWEKIHFFFGDERYVPLDDPQSNYLNADVHLFSKLPIPGENIHPMPTQDNDPVLSALHYEKHLRTFFKIDADQFPLFDLVYLGLGENSHTASLFPYEKIPQDKFQLVEGLYIKEVMMERLSLTPSAINHSKSIIFLVTGENKATAVKNVIEGSHNPDQYPGQLIDCLYGDTYWLLDKFSAKKLHEG